MILYKLVFVFLLASGAQEEIEIDYKFKTVWACRTAIHYSFSEIAQPEFIERQVGEQVTGVNVRCKETSGSFMNLFN